MIGFTLRPHEDELLYSIIARHGTLIRRTDATDLTAQVRAAAGGSEATVTFVRDGETQTVEVTLGELAP